MFEVSSKKVNFLKDNVIIKKNINLDSNLDCFILIDSSNEKLSELLLNNILEYLIDRINTSNVYNDFQAALENVNSFLKTWNIDSKDDEEIKLNVIISILHKNNFIFSNIGKSSCYLLKNNRDLIEITDDERGKKPKDFNFISNGTLNDNEIVIMSTNRILSHLSENDIIDGLNSGEEIKDFNKNIKEILLTEKLKRNVGVTSIKYNAFSKDYISENKWLILKDFGMKILDNKFFKTFAGSGMKLKDKAMNQNTKVKNGIFLVGITICLFVLYSIINAIIGASTSYEEKIELKDNLTKAKTFISRASENISNEDIFNQNLENAQALVDEVKNENLYLNDVEKINDDISILKKQFNKVDTFEAIEENYLFKQDLTNAVRVIKNNKKTYVIRSKSILGPIIPNSKPDNYTFNALEKDERFVDAAVVGTDIYLKTNFSKIVRFTSTNKFSYVDVLSQSSWLNSKDLESYAQNIYLLGEEDNQIYKHSRNGNKFNKGTPYLNEEDQNQIGNILSMAIDGGFYILKEDLSMLKFFASPTYRMESLSLNGLPKNYNKEEGSKIELKASNDYNYVYLLMNEKIWVFKPNSTNNKNTQSLTYIGQIEGQDSIKDFYVNYDGELLLLNDKGIYKLTFEVSDDRLIIR